MAHKGLQGLLDYTRLLTKNVIVLVATSTLGGGVDPNHTAGMVTPIDRIFGIIWLMEESG